MYMFSIAILVIKFGWIFALGTIIQPPNVNPKEDAKSIFRATDKDEELIRILPHRRSYHRRAIAEEYKKIDPKNPLIPNGYVPLRGDPFRDLVFVMTTNQDNVDVAFIHAALQSTTSEIFATLVAKILIPSDEYKLKLINAYDRNVDIDNSLLDTIFMSTITNQHKNFLQNLIQINREREPATWRTNAKERKKISYMANMLVQESRGWESNRMILDYILMNKSTKFGRLVMMEFNRVNPEGEDILTAIDKHIPDNNVKLDYKYLVKNVADEALFLVDVIHGNENEPYDQHANNILFITMFSESFLAEFDVLFTQKYGQCISEYLLSKNNTDPVNRMLAAMAKGDDCRSSKRDAAGDGGVFGAGTWDL